MIASGAPSPSGRPAQGAREQSGPPWRRPTLWRAAGRGAQEGAIAGSATAAAVIGLALADGGYGALAVGVVAIAAWAAVLGLAVTRPAIVALRRPLAIASGALIVLAALTAFTLGRTPDPGAAFEDLVRVLAYLGVLLLAGMALRSRGAVRGALAGIATGVVVVALLALAARLGGLAGGGPELAAGLAPAAGRLSFPIGYWNALGALLALAVPILIQIAGRGPGRLVSGLATAGLVPVLLAAYMTSSRGALLAAALGALVVIGRERSGARPLAALLAGLLAALPSCLAAGLAGGILSGPWRETGREELLVAGALLAGVAAALALGPAVIGAAARRRPLRVRPWAWLAAAAALAGIALVLAGPGGLAGDFRALPPAGEGSGALPLTASGSGRAQFWDAAVGAFASEPLRGIGAAGYESWWNAHGTLDTPTRSAHSEPLELLAELGLPGLGAFAVLLFAIWLAARPRGPGRGPEGRGAGGEEAAAAGVLVAVAIGVAIDWSWDVPAVIVPALIAAGALAGPALAGCGTDAEVPGRDGPSVADVTPSPGGIATRPGIASFAIVIGVAVAALWAASVLALSSAQLEAADDALAAGRLGDAAAAARSAAAIEPWDSRPWLSLAAIERSAGNLPAARRAVAAAIERAPADIRAWLLAGALASESGERRAGDAYAARAYLLAPRVLPRAVGAAAGAPG